MGKADSVAAQVAAVQAGELAVLQAGLGACFDDGVASVPPTTVGFTQADIDAAVKAAEAVDATALAEAHTKAEGELSTLNTQLVAALAAKQVEDQIVSNLQMSVAAVQKSLDDIKSLVQAALAGG